LSDLFGPISLYIHIPFCIQKCRYCDFYSEVKPAIIPDYIDSLLKEIRLKLAPGQNIDTVYLGGGTPSLLSVSQIESILETLTKICHINPEAEITCELNPGTITGTLNSDYLSGLRQTGVNRLSIGVQSFNEDKLKFLGRIHSAAEAVSTIDNAAKAGFENISLDFIYGLPKESTADWIMDQKKALEFNPSHLSCYMLTIEAGTPLATDLEKELFVPFDQEMMADWFKMTSQYLTEAGFEHYEISNFSRGQNKRSRHNSRYWDMLPYTGLGAGSHSFDGAVRSWNHSNIDKYIKDIKADKMPVEASESLNMDQQMAEMIMLRLRTLEGLNLRAFERKFAITFQSRFKNILNMILAEKLGEIKKRQFFLSLEGRTRLDSIVEAFASEIV
jgi:oxygen-independent coproporphyrinogen III oxidase